MKLQQLTTIFAFRQFLDGTQAVPFSVATTKKERYQWVRTTLVKHRYLALGKADKGTVTCYLEGHRLFSGSDQAADPAVCQNGLYHG